MKTLIAIAALCLFSSAPVYSQQEQGSKPPETAPATKAPDKSAHAPAEKAPKQATDKPPAPKAQEQSQSAPAQHQADQKAAERQSKDQQKEQQQAQKDQEKGQREQAKAQQQNQKEQQKSAAQQARSQDQSQERGQVAANAPANGNARRIPDDRFRKDFGRGHTFHVRRANDRRFQFGGFWFTYYDAWPADWTDGDDFYVDDIDGTYYLCDDRHPEERIVVVVVS